MSLTPNPGTVVTPHQRYAAEASGKQPYFDFSTKRLSSSFVSCPRHCAEWAVEMAERSSSSELGHFVKHLEELRKLEKDSVFGAEFGVMRVGRTGVGPVKMSRSNGRMTLSPSQSPRANELDGNRCRGKTYQRRCWPSCHLQSEQSNADLKLNIIIPFLEPMPCRGANFQ